MDDLRSLPLRGRISHFSKFRFLGQPLDTWKRADDWSLDRSDSGLSDISSLDLKNDLQRLILNNNAIRNISPIFGLKQLRVLDLSRNQIETVDGIQVLHALEEIHLQGNQIKEVSSLSGLGGLPALRLVYLRDNPISFEPNEGFMHFVSLLEDAGAIVAY